MAQLRVRLDKYAVPIAFSDLVAHASVTPTFVPSWPPPAGHAWVVYVPRSDGQSNSFHARAPADFECLVSLFPRAIWFSTPVSLLARIGAASS